MAKVVPKILCLLVGRDDGVVESYFGIKHENKLWLVTAWLRKIGAKEAVPERMIRVDLCGATPGEPGSQFDYVNILLPRVVIEGLSQEVEGYEVRSLPDSPVVNWSDLKTLPSVFS